MRALWEAIKRYFNPPPPPTQEVHWTPPSDYRDEDEPYEGQLTRCGNGVSFNRTSVATRRVNKRDPITRKHKRVKTDRVCRRHFYASSGELVADDETPFDKEGTS